MSDRPNDTPSQESRRIGQYELHTLLGRGGMAEVYKAYQSSLDRFVALKLVRPMHAADPEYIGRFQREARAAAQLSHPNIVQVYDFGEENGIYFIAQRYNSVTDMVRAFSQAFKSNLPSLTQPVSHMSLSGPDTLEYDQNQPTTPLPPGKAVSETGGQLQPTQAIVMNVSASPRTADNSATNVHTLEDYFGYKGMSGLAPVVKGIDGPTPTRLAQPQNRLALPILLGVFGILLLSLVVLLLVLLPSVNEAGGKETANRTALAAFSATTTALGGTVSAQNTQLKALNTCAFTLGGIWNDLDGVRGKVGSNPQGTGGCISALESREGKDFALEFDLPVQGSESIENMAGVYLRSRDDPQAGAYFLQLAITGAARDKEKGGLIIFGKIGPANESTTLTSYASEVLLRRNIPYHFKLIVSGDKFQVFFDYLPQPIVSLSDATFAAGRFGFFVTNATALFSNLKLNI